MKNSDLMYKYGIALGQRYKYSEKLACLDEIKADLHLAEADCELYEFDQGRKHCVNLYIGSLKTAKKIIIAPIDTPLTSILMELKYYPINTRKNIGEKTKDALTRSLLFTAGVMIIAGIVLNYPRLGFPYNLIGLLLGGALGIVAIGFSVKKASKVNLSLYSASLVCFLNLFEDLKSDPEIAFVLVDDYCNSLMGLRVLEKYIDRSTVELYVLDSLNSIELLHVVTGKDEMSQQSSVLREFPKSALFVTARQDQDDLVIDHVSSGSDFKIDMKGFEENILKIEKVIEGGLL